VSYDVVIQNPGGGGLYSGWFAGVSPYKTDHRKAAGSLFMLIFRVASERDHTDPELGKFFETQTIVDLKPDLQRPEFEDKRWRIRVDEISDEQIDEYRQNGVIEIDELDFLNMTEALDTRERLNLPGVVPLDKRPDHNQPLHVNENVSERLKRRDEVREQPGRP
jgi:hypothetical protein